MAEEAEVDRTSSAGLFRVDGIVALITGGGSGIGLMMTKALALNGANKVYISGRREELLLEAQKLSPHDNIIPIVADVSSKESIEALAEKIRQETGYLNLLIANAGAYGPGPDQPPGGSLREFQAEIMKTSTEDWDQVFRVNITHCYFLTAAVLDLLDEGNRRQNYFRGEVKSQVILTSSVGGFIRTLGQRYAYRVSKAAVTHLGKVMASGFQEFGIRVNVLAPGFFPSDMAEELINVYMQSADAEGRIDARMLPERRIGSEEDMMGTVLYMASAAGAYSNGNVQVVDGGILGVLSATY